MYCWASSRPRIRRWIGFASRLMLASRLAIFLSCRSQGLSQASSCSTRLASVLTMSNRGRGGRDQSHPPVAARVTATPATMSHTKGRAKKRLRVGGELSRVWRDSAASMRAAATSGCGCPFPGSSRPFELRRVMSGGTCWKHHRHRAGDRDRWRRRARREWILDLSCVDRQREDPQACGRESDHQDEHGELATQRLATSGKEPQSLRVRQVNADEVAEYDGAHLRMPYDTGRHGDGLLLQELSRAEEIPSEGERIGDERQEPRRVGEQQREVVADVIDKSDRYQ